MFPSSSTREPLSLKGKQNGLFLAYQMFRYVAVQNVKTSSHKYFPVFFAPFRRLFLGFEV